MPPAPRGRGRGRGGRSRGGHGGFNVNRPEYSPVASGNNSPMHIDDVADSPPTATARHRVAASNQPPNDSWRRGVPSNLTNLAPSAVEARVNMPNGDKPVDSMPNGRKPNTFGAAVVRQQPRSPAVASPSHQHHEEIPVGGEAGDDGWDKSLSQWGIPEKVVQIYREAKIINFFRWQYDCLLRGDVLDGKNFVYSAPTSAGKTLVAEVLLLKRVCEDRCKGMMVLPYISVATEKLYSLRKRFASAGIKVDGYIGSSNANWDRTQIAICTFEKANALINRLVEEKRMDELGIIVIDELHMIGDRGRGYLLELLLTKLRFLSEKSVKQLQIIGMSATLPNLPSIAKWLGADSYVTDFRPVPLTEFVRIGDSLYDKHFNFVRKIDIPEGLPKLRTGDDVEGICALMLETVTMGKSVLCFCNTKMLCENLCNRVSDCFRRLSKAQRAVFINDVNLSDISEQLRRSPAGLEPLIAKLLKDGVAFHHASLSMYEREIIEDGFRNGIVKVIIATTTLAAGVNLPAYRVIIRNPYSYDGHSMIDALTYKQMSGRAGRKGLDELGESVLCIANDTLKEKIRPMLQQQLRPVDSCLDPQMGGGDGSETITPPVAAGEEPNSIDYNYRLTRALLEIISNGLANTTADVGEYLSKTLWITQLTEKRELLLQRAAMTTAEQASSVANISAEVNTLEIAKTYVAELVRLELVRHMGEDGRLAANAVGDDLQAAHALERQFIPTKLGSAVVRSSMTPYEGQRHLDELHTAQQKLNLETDLHLIYLVTPMSRFDDGRTNIPWQWFHDYFVEKLPVELKRVAELVHVDRKFILRKLRKNDRRDDAPLVKTHVRFYYALLLYDLINEMPLYDVAAKFGVDKGRIQSMQQEAATLAGMLTVFCRELGWRTMNSVLADFQSRLQYGVQKELVELVRIEFLTGKLARVLFDRGFTNLPTLAAAEVDIIEKLLKNAMPFKSDRFQTTTTTAAASATQAQKALVDESPTKAEPAANAGHAAGGKHIHLEGVDALSDREAAQLIIDEAKRILQEDMAAAGFIITRAADVTAEAALVDNSNVPGVAVVDSEDAEIGIVRDRSGHVRVNLDAANASSSPWSVGGQSRGPVFDGDEDMLSPSAAQQQHSKTQQADLKSPPNAAVAGGGSHVALNNVANNSKIKPQTMTLGSVVEETPPHLRGVANSVHSPPPSDTEMLSPAQVRMKQQLNTNNNNNKSSPANSMVSLCGGGDSSASSKSQQTPFVTAAEALERRRAAARLNQSLDSGQSMIAKSPLVPVAANKNTSQRQVLSLGSGDKLRSSNGGAPKSTADRDMSKFAADFQTPAIYNQKQQPPPDRSSGKLLSSALPAVTSAKDNKMLVSSDEALQYLNFDDDEGTGNDNGGPVVPVNANTTPPNSQQRIISRSSGVCSDRIDDSPERPFQAAQRLPSGSSTVGNSSYDKPVIDEDEFDTLFASNRKQRTIHTDQEAAEQIDEIPESDAEDDGYAAVGERAGNSSSGSSTILPAVRGTGNVNKNQQQTSGTSAAAVRHEPYITAQEADEPSIWSEAGALLSPDKFVSAAQKSCGILIGPAAAGSSRRIGLPQTPRKRPRNADDDAGTSPSTRTAAFGAAVAVAQRCNKMPRLNSDPTLVPANADAQRPFGAQSSDDVKLLSSIVPAAVAAGAAPGTTNISADQDRGILRLRCFPFVIVDVARDRETYKKFLECCRIFQHFSLSVAGRDCIVGTNPEVDQINPQIARIGPRAKPTNPNSPRKAVNTDDGFEVDFGMNSEKFRVFGIAVHFSEKRGTVFYFPLTEWYVKTMSPQQQQTKKIVDVDVVKYDIPVQQRLADLRDIFHVQRRWSNTNREIIALFAALPCRVLKTLLSGPSEAPVARLSRSNSNVEVPYYVPDGDHWVDPLIAEWIINMADSPRELYAVISEKLGGIDRDAMTAAHAMFGAGKIGTFFKNNSIGLAGARFFNDSSALRLAPMELAAGEAYLSTSLISVMHQEMSKLKENLAKLDVSTSSWTNMLKVEMPTQIIMSLLTDNGIGFDDRTARMFENALRQKKDDLQAKGVEAAKVMFDLGNLSILLAYAQNQVGQVLYQECKVPPPPGARRVGKKGKITYSTKRELLLQVQDKHPLVGIILRFRRIDKLLQDYMNSLRSPFHNKVNRMLGNMYRVHPKWHGTSATGRIMSFGADLQKIPNDFNVSSVDDEYAMLDADTQDLPQYGAGGGEYGGGDGDEREQQLRFSQFLQRVQRDEVFNASGNSLLASTPSSVGGGQQPPSRDDFVLSMRRMFRPFAGGIMLCADYSQVELRLLAHFAQDENLIEIFNSGGDVFKAVASKMKSIPVEDVTFELRQLAKRICYGMLYGIGASSLAAQLGVERDVAVTFMREFFDSFPNVQIFIQTTIILCKQFGYVTTLGGHLRRFTNINNDNERLRSTAERAAVNTKLQGSAADICKQAMTTIEHELMRTFKCRPRSLSQQDLQAWRSRAPGFADINTPPPGAYLVHNLHDELIYEVNENDLPVVARIVKQGMEQAMALTVPISVQIRVGPSWGEANPYRVSDD